MAKEENWSSGGFGILNFIREESLGGFILILCVIIALVWANSPFAESYHHIWHEINFGISLGDFEMKYSLHHWVNDGLMAIFFFTVGLEIKREVLGGELSSIQKATMPVIAAVGGMLFPALIFAAINIHHPGYIDGWGIPMATDIAFALGILSLMGNRIPLSLKVFLTALAIADDLGAILVIAIFYTESINVFQLINGGIFLLLLIGANRLGIRRTTFYAFIGILGVWVSFMYSGVHATIAGVLIALTIPVRKKISEKSFIDLISEKLRIFKHERMRDAQLLTEHQSKIINDIEKLSYEANTPLQRLEHSLHPVTSYIILPLFALANAGVHIEGNFFRLLWHPVAIGIILGLILGKFIGISFFTHLMVWLKIGKLPDTVRWKHIYGAGFLAGIGFTMSLFISDLAYVNDTYVEIAKIGIFIASFLSALAGIFILKST